MLSQILASLSHTSSSSLTAFSRLTSKLPLRHFIFPNCRLSAAASMDTTSSPSSLDSISEDLKNQRVENNNSVADGAINAINSDNRAKLKLEELRWDHSFVRDLPGDPRTDTIPREVLHSCYTKVSPSAEVDNPQLVAWSDSVAELLDLDAKEFERPDIPQIYSGAQPLVGAMPYGQCYGGHQFGMWAGQLGDGRAITLENLSKSDSLSFSIGEGEGSVVDLTSNKYAGLLKQSQVMTGENSKPITRVLFCGPHFPASHNYTIEYLQSHPFIKVDVVPFEEIPGVIGNYDICVVKNMRLNSDIIARANKMKLIMQFGVGLEGIDIDAATKHGIKVARIPSDNTGNATSCAEMAIYLMLGLLRKQYEMQVSIRERKLGEPAGDTLLGKTVFILGYGNIGIQLAKRLRSFGVNILATKRSWPFASQDNVDELVDEKGSHKDIVKFARRADIVVCCLAMNRETAGIVDAGFISSMRKGALLVNVARGGLLDYDAVVAHLKSGHLGGLGTDVAWTEPFDPNNAIFKFPNVIMTPHVAGVTECSYRAMSKVVGDVAVQLHSGACLTGVEIVN